LAEVEKITAKLVKLNPKFIFKKIDSVLRGHVAKELEVQMKLVGKNKALIVAANPAVGRTIVNGCYFVDDLPLNKTSFADDLDFPVRSAVVTEIVQSSQFPVVSLRLGAEWPVAGLIIADVSSHEELVGWASHVDDDLVLAGGSGFFDTLLQSLYSPKKVESPADLLFGESSLFIFGSMFPKDAGMLEKFNNDKVVRMNMPEGIYFGSDLRTDLLEDWSDEVATQLKTGCSVMITIDHLPGDETGLSLRLRESIGQLVSKVEKQFNLNDLFIEGGATASVVLKYMNVTKLFPFHEADFGIIQMKAEGYPNLCITTKPGSYL